MTEVQEGTVVEIVLNTQTLGDEDVEIRPHSLSIHSYKTPTFCDFCREMLFGMFKQVLTPSMMMSEEEMMEGDRCSKLNYYILSSRGSNVNCAA